MQSIHPGYVDTDMTSSYPGGMKPEDSANMMVEVMEKASTIEATGKFVSYKDGKEEPW